MSETNELKSEINAGVETPARPLGRSSARELSVDEIASIAGGYTTGGISNSPGGGGDDRDLVL